MNKINWNVPSLQNKDKKINHFTKKFAVPLLSFLALSGLNTQEVKANYWKEIYKTIGSNEFDINYWKETDKEEYIKKNLFINWKNITEWELKANIKEIDKDIVEITYTHTFEWVEWYISEQKTNVKINVEFTYKDNNIFINIDKVSIWWTVLKNQNLTFNDILVYDYDFSMEEDKSLQFNTKFNPYKTQEKIENKIQKTKFNLSCDAKNIEELENTQITTLNKIKLGKEIFKEKDEDNEDEAMWFYKEIYFYENWKYRTICKVFFDKEGNIDWDKTKKESWWSFDILWVKVDYKISKNSETEIDFSIDKKSLESLEKKVKELKEQIIEIVDNAEVWPNKIFEWFNKTKEERVWSEWEEVRLFDTKLIGLEIIDDIYTFQRWAQTHQKMSFWTDGKDVYLVDWNNTKTDKYYVTSWKNYFSISLKDNELKIKKIKKEKENDYNHLPNFVWDKDITNILNNQELLTQYDDEEEKLNYFNTDGMLITSIETKKTKDWEYKINQQETDIDIYKLYNYKKFQWITNKINEEQEKLKVLGVDVLNIFKDLLDENWLNTEEQNLLKVVDQEWNIFYCKAEWKWDEISVEKDEELYQKTKDDLEEMKCRLETLNKLKNVELKRKNKWQVEDFTEFVWWGRGIWIRLLSQEEIYNFVSGKSSEIDLFVLRWEWQETVVTYDRDEDKFMKKMFRWSWNTVFRLPDYIIIGWQEYSYEFKSENWKIKVYLDPKEE